MAEQYDAWCIGRYIDLHTHDHVDFTGQMMRGVSIQQYAYNEQHAGPRLFIGPGQSGRNPFQIYEYCVNGRFYYGATKIGYSPDIHRRRAGQTCKVYYRSDNPYISDVSGMEDSVPSSQATPWGIAAMVCGILSLVLCWVPFLGLLPGGGSVFLGVNSFKRQKENNIFSIAGLVMAGFGILSSLIVSVIFIILLAMGKSYLGM